MADKNKHAAVAKLLQQASEILVSDESTIEPPTSNIGQIQRAASNASSMLSASCSNCTFSRLNCNERLRATNQNSRYHPYVDKNKNNKKKQPQTQNKKVPEKVFEIALIKCNDDEFSDEEDQEQNHLKWDSVIGNGIINISEDDDKDIVVIEDESPEKTNNFTIKDFFKTYEIDFQGELAEDEGGPRKEWLRLCCAEIKSVYFDKGIKEHMADDYYKVGIIIGTSLFQSGPTPKFLPQEIIESVLNESKDELKAIQKLRQGMNRLGIVDTLKLFPQIKTAGQMSVKKLLQTLKPNLITRQKEIYKIFVKYVRDVASGRRVVKLPDILSFTTGTANEPFLRFVINTSIKFVPRPDTKEVIVC
ncbi:uncharacterized protein [Clytia hemisphaerica]|uniref:uncharacterized protein n=1 Tax=Clytia hemisphaerica TaxID=252671 RepID=UPI0034D52449